MRVYELMVLLGKCQAAAQIDVQRSNFIDEGETDVPSHAIEGLDTDCEGFVFINFNSDKTSD